MLHGTEAAFVPNVMGNLEQVKQRIGQRADIPSLFGFDFNGQHIGPCSWCTFEIQI